MSTMALVEGPSGVVAAWETDGQIYFATIKPGTTEYSSPQGAPGRTNARRHPAVAFNSHGDMILAWTEGTGWQKGGALAWQVFDSKGRATSEKGRIERGIPVWGLPTAISRDGG